METNRRGTQGILHRPTHLAETRREQDPVKKMTAKHQRETLIVGPRSCVQSSYRLMRLSTWKGDVSVLRLLLVLVLVFSALLCCVCALGEEDDGNVSGPELEWSCELSGGCSSWLRPET